MESALRVLALMLCVAAIFFALYAALGGAAKYWSRPLVDEQHHQAPVGTVRVEEIDQPTAPIYGREFT